MRSRRLFNLASILSPLLLALLTIMIGSISVWGDRSHRSLHLFGPWEFSTSLGRMGVQIIVFHAWPAPVAGPLIPTTRPTQAQYMAFKNQFPHHLVWRGPFAFEYGPIPTIRANRLQAVGTRTWFMFPYRALAATLLLLPAIRFLIIPLIAKLRAPRRRGGCTTCGYNLTGNTSGVCPECGIAIPPL